ncbi:arylamine N-acetyltransferase [Trebonia kvetii]|uniref:Arylamine N-acetyltransferase n=1 Tax=Trebonia kvetii TaxID=2480626 RepID=A0A6P2C0Q5_9ACTN|nr:arylamine N-acetyltransferase [Trebonia kvetii]TVZ04944.1 arylamine N-acetyltransferase [Trebonia kvetii]
MSVTTQPGRPIPDNSKKRETVTGYLSRLGLRDRPAPTVAALTELHRRHLDAIPYENLAIMLGRPDSTDPGQTLARVAAGGNAGYCFHHNGAFELVLRDLGFAVERRFGQVWNKPEDRAVPELNHLVLLVTVDGRPWWPDLGLGDALRDPVEVIDGEIRQGPFRYEISGASAQGWTFRHDPAAGSFGYVDVRPASPAPADVAASHLMLSSPPDGRFTRVLVVQRRDDTGTGVLRGIRLQRIGDQPFTRDLTAYGDWRAALESMRVSLAGVTDGELRSLHARMLAAHEEWAAADGN